MVSPPLAINGLCIPQVFLHFPNVFSPPRENARDAVGFGHPVYRRSSHIRFFRSNEKVDEMVASRKVPKGTKDLKLQEFNDVDEANRV